MRIEDHPAVVFHYEEEEPTSCLDKNSPCNRVMDTFGSIVGNFGECFILAIGAMGGLTLAGSVMRGDDFYSGTLDAVNQFSIPFIESTALALIGRGIQNTANMN